MTTIERNETLTEMIEELIEIAPDIYKMPFPESLNWVAAFFYKDAVFYNTNFTGKQCETIVKSLDEMSAIRTLKK